MNKKSVISDYLAEIGRKGGLKGGTAKVPKGTAMLTPEQRSELAKQAAAKRWGTKKKTAAKKNKSK